MFSTLLGLLPRPEQRGMATDEDERPSLAPPTGSATDDDKAVLAALADSGLELLATGRPPASGNDSADTVVTAWRRATEAVDRPVKQVLAGPFSEGRNASRSTPIQLAESLRETIVALGDAGCSFIEIDEPDALAVGVVEGERRRFVEAHRRLLDGASGLHLSLALTGGNVDRAGPSTFFDLGYASFAFDLIAGPDNWRLIAAAPGDRGIVCGALDPRPDGDETAELLVWAAHYAASTGGRGIDRVGIANAPSLADVPWDVAIRKLRRVAEAATTAGLQSPSELAGRLDPRVFGGRRNRPGGPVRLTGPEP